MARPETLDANGLRAEKVSVSYGRASVVEALDLDVPPGVFTALVGPNGSGKSTVLRTLSRLMRPQRGEVLLSGQDIAALPASTFARRVGHLAQGPHAPEGFTVGELVQQGRYAHRTLFGGWTRADEAACRQALERTGMTAFATRPLDSLSGGQRQRVWISMALAQQTDILLLDEPTTYLDLSHQIEIMELLRDLVSDGKTVVAVLHDLNQAARYATHIVLLDAGKIVLRGTPDEVMTPENIRRVFGIDASVMPDPFTGTPFFLPRPRSWREAR